MSRSLAVPDLSDVLQRMRFDAWVGKVNALFGLSAVVMVASLVLGGATRPGYISDVIIQVLAIPLLLAALWKMFEFPLTRQMQLALFFCLAIALLPLVQLVPLPPWLWTWLPNRQPSTEAFEILGRAIPWMPISVSPRATWLSALSMIPPLAIFLATLLLGYRERRSLSLVIIAVGIVSAFLGMLQVAQGEASPLRFFAITNRSEAVGFFANRNHFAALLYSLLLFVVAWTQGWAPAKSGHEKKKREFDTASIMAVIGGLTVVVIFLSAEVLARSRAGVGLTIVALFGAAALGLSNRREGAAIMSTKLLFGAVALALIFASQFALYRFQERFSDPTQDDRPVFTRTTIEAANAYMPRRVRPRHVCSGIFNVREAARCVGDLCQPCA